MADRAYERHSADYLCLCMLKRVFQVCILQFEQRLCLLNLSLWLWVALRHLEIMKNEKKWRRDRR